MKVLIIDDDEIKVRAISDAINTSARSSLITPSISVADNLSDGIRQANCIRFELVVIDLMLPYIRGSVAEASAGLELLGQIRRQGCINASSAIVCLSSFPDEISASRDKYTKYGVLIVEFDANGTWKDSLGHKIRDIQSRSTAKIDLDFLIVCALEEERQGFASTEIELIATAVVSKLNICYARIGGQKPLTGAILRLSQMGLIASTYEIALAMNLFRTKVLCMSGICAGFEENARLGQLIVPSPCWEYQAGKWSSNGFEIAPQQIPLSASTKAIVDHVISQENFLRYVEEGVRSGSARPGIQSIPVLAPFGTGSAVIANTKRLVHIKQQHRKIAGLDMEVFGLYYVAHAIGTDIEHYFAIKCVVDLANRAKADNLHNYGCVVSARATERILRQLLT